MAKKYSWDYEEDHYHIFNVGDDALDESFLFPTPEDDECDKLIQNLTNALSDCCDAGDRNTIDKPDCQLSADERKLLIQIGVYLADEIGSFDMESDGLSVFWREVKALIKRRTIIINRQAAYLRGDR